MTPKELESTWDRWINRAQWGIFLALSAMFATALNHKSIGLALVAMTLAWSGLCLWNVQKYRTLTLAAWNDDLQKLMASLKAGDAA